MFGRRHNLLPVLLALFLLVSIQAQGKSNVPVTTREFSNKVICWSVRSSSAWVVTNKSALMTNDAGKHWRKMDTRLNPIRQLMFLDPKNGWLVSETKSHTRIWRTSDGGTTWTIISEIPIANLSSVRQIEFVDQLTGWMIAIGGVWKTDDGGLSWRRIFSPREYGADAIPAQGAFVGSNKAWVFGEHGEVFSTTDSGRHWHTQNIQSGVTFNRIQFATESVGWIHLPVTTRFDGELYKTVDGGKSWTLQRGLPDGSTLISVFFIDQDRGWGVGQSTERLTEQAVPVLMRTVGGGTNWQPLAIKASDAIFWDVKFVDSTRGWLVGDDYLYHTEDGGNEWRPVLDLNRPL